MTQDISNSQEYLNKMESEALKYQDLAHGARAKQAAARLGSLIGLSEDASAEFITGLGSAMDSGALFEERRDIAAHLNAISGILGYHVINAANNSELKVVEHDQPELNSGADDLSENPEPEIIIKANVIALRKYNFDWLVKAFGQTHADSISAMNETEREAMVARLGELYENMTVPRHSSNHKKQRPESLSLFLKNYKTKDIANQAGLTPQGLQLGLNGMVSAITSRVSPEQLSEAISGTSTNEVKTNKQSEPVQQIGIKPLPFEQPESDMVRNRETVLIAKRKFLNNVYGEDYEGIADLMRLDEVQSGQFVARLAIFIKEYYKRKESTTAVERRIDSVAQLLIAGNLPPAIAILHKTSAKTISGELYRTALMLKERIDAKELHAIAQKSKNYTASNE